VIVLEEPSQETASPVVTPSLFVDKLNPGGFAKDKISVIMPAYNEEAVIVGSISDIKKRTSSLGREFEIIVVDDGSTDATRRVAEAAVNDQRIRVVGYGTNKGKGHALRFGFKHATGEFTLFADSDSEISPDRILPYLSALENAEIAIASKRHPQSKVQVPIVRRILSYYFNMITRIVTGLNVSDTQTGLKAVRSSAFYRIVPFLSVKRYAFDVEFLVVASLMGMRIRQLPVEITLDATFSIRKIVRMMVDLLGITYRLRVKRWYQTNLRRFDNTYAPLINW
jgi:glycosyltransferase involved in cell wall biosynthesis